MIRVDCYQLSEQRHGSSSRRLDNVCLTLKPSRKPYLLIGLSYPREGIEQSIATTGSSYNETRHFQPPAQLNLRQLLIRRHFPKYLLHLLAVRRPLWTVDEALNLRQILHRLVDILVARIVATSPPLQLLPAPALPDLAHPRLRASGRGRITRRVVGVADNVLPQRVDAVDHVAPAS